MIWQIAPQFFTTDILPCAGRIVKLAHIWRFAMHTRSDAVEPYVDVSIETSYTRIEQRDDACGFSGRGRWSRGSE